MKKILFLCIITMLLASCAITDSTKKEYDLLSGKKENKTDEKEFNYNQSKEERQKKLIESQISGEIKEYWNEKYMPIKNDSEMPDDLANYTEVGTMSSTTFSVPFVVNSLHYTGDGFIVSNGIFQIRDIPARIDEILIKDSKNITVSHTKVINYTTAGQIQNFSQSMRYLFIPIGNFTENTYIDASALSKSGTPRLRQSLDNKTNTTNP